MMLTIHGIPMSATYKDIKRLVKQECSINDFILDNLVTDDDGFKKVRIGVNDDSDGSQLMKCLNGYNLSGNVIRVVPVGKPAQHNQSSFDTRGGYQPRNEFHNQLNSFGNQPMLDNQPRPNAWAPNMQWPGVSPQMPQNTFVNQPQPTIVNSYVQQQQPRAAFPPGRTSVPQQQPAQQNFRFAAKGNIERTITVLKDNFPGPGQYEAQPPMAQGHFQVQPHIQPSPWNQQVVVPVKPQPFEKPTSGFNQTGFNDRQVSKGSVHESGYKNYDKGEHRYESQIRGPSPGKRLSPRRKISPESARRMSPSGLRGHRLVSPGPSSRRISPTGPQGRRMSPSGPQSRRMSPSGPLGRRMSPSGSQGRRVSPSGRPSRRMSPTETQGRQVLMPGSLGRRMSPSSPHGRGMDLPGSQGRRMSPPGPHGRRISPSGLQGRLRVSPPGSHGRRMSPPGPHGRRMSPTGPMGHRISPPGPHHGRRLSPSGIPGPPERRMSPGRSRRISPPRMGGPVPTGRGMSPTHGRRISPPRIGGPHGDMPHGRKISPGPPGRRMSPGRRISPGISARHISPDRRMSSGRELPPDRRISPDRRMSGRQSPGRRASPGRVSGRRSPLMDPGSRGYLERNDCHGKHERHRDISARYEGKATRNDKKEERYKEKERARRYDKQEGRDKEKARDHDKHEERDKEKARHYDKQEERDKERTTDRDRREEFYEQKAMRYSEKEVLYEQEWNRYMEEVRTYVGEEENDERYEENMLRNDYFNYSHEEKELVPFDEYQNVHDRSSIPANSSSDMEIEDVKDLKEDIIVKNTEEKKGYKPPGKRSGAASRRYRDMVARNIPPEEAYAVCHKPYSELPEKYWPKKRDLPNKESEGSSQKKVKPNPSPDPDNPKTDSKSNVQNIGRPNQFFARVCIENTSPMVKKQRNLVLRALIGVIQTCDEGMGPRIHAVTKAPHRLIVYCKDKYSQAWLTEKVPKLQPWPDARLTATVVEEPLKYTVVNAFIPSTETSDMNEAFALINAQNRGLNTYLWKIIKQASVGGGHVLIISVDPWSFTVLKEKNFNVCIGFRSIPFTVGFPKKAKSKAASSLDKPSLLETPNLDDSV